MRVIHFEHSKLQEAGMASILFTMIMMIVISLIVLGFAQLARRGQQETLDSQLSTQAFYAAESGINDAEQAVSGLIAHGDSTPNNSSCTLNATYSNYFTNTLNISQNLSTANDVANTCLLVSTQPGSLVSSVSTSQSSELTIQTTPSPADKLTLSWAPGASGSLTNCPLSSSSSFPPNTSSANGWNNCPYGVVRVDLVPVAGSSVNLSRSSLLTSTMTVFLVPASNATSGTTGYYVSSPAVNQGARVAASCTSASCTATITGLPNTVTTYAMRVISLYQSAPNFTVTAFDSDTNPLDFSNGQAVIDSTGQAQNVLRRIEVRMDLGSREGGYADYAIQSEGSVCKKFGVIPGQALADAGDNACATNP